MPSDEQESLQQAKMSSLATWSGTWERQTPSALVKSNGDGVVLKVSTEST